MIGYRIKVHGTNQSGQDRYVTILVNAEDDTDVTDVIVRAEFALAINPPPNWSIGSDIATIEESTIEQVYDGGYSNATYHVG